MHTNFPLGIVLAGLIFCLSTIDLSGQAINSNDLLNPSQVPTDFYGFNGEYMIDQCLDTDDPRTNPPEPLNTLYLDQTCKLLVDDLNPGLIRFPGGTTANYYHYNGTGYGYQEDEIFGTLIGAMEIGFDELMPVNFIELFADLALQTNSKVIFTLNLYTHFKPGGASLNNPESEAYQTRFQENMDAIAYLVGRGVDLVGIELGNELYTYAELTSIFTIGTAIDKYLELASDYANAIDALYPGLKVGVPVAIHAGFGNIFWNEKMQGAEFADGVIPHEYERKIYSGCDPELGQTTYFNCAQTTINEFFDTDFEEAVTEYFDLYPNKEVWLTEWGMSQPQGVSNTLFDAYFVFKYWNKIMEIEKAYPGRVAYTNRHNLVTGGYYYSAFGNRLLAEADDVLYMGDKAIRANAYSSLLMKDIYNGSHQFIGKTTVDDCDVWIYTQGGVNYKLAVINETEDTAALEITTINNLLEQTNLEFSNISYLTGEEFYSAAGINYYDQGNGGLSNHLSYNTEVEAADPGTMDIPSLSLSIVEVIPGEIEPFALNSFGAAAENCDLTFDWNVTSDDPAVQYHINVNGAAFDTVLSTGYSISNSYSHSVPFDQTGTFIFEITAISGGQEIGTLAAAPLQLECAPIPDPEIISVQQDVDESCGLITTWTVDNDVVGATYDLSVSQQILGEVFSTSIASNGSGTYSNTFQLASNGNYTSSVSLVLEEGLTSPATSPAVTVDCIIPDAAVTNAGIDQNTDCSFEVNWSVSNETDASSYIIYITHNSQTDIFETVASQGDQPSAEYSVDFTPVENGEYIFSIEHSSNGNVVSVHDNLIADVSCIEPAFTGISFIANEACETVLSWTVENDQPGTQYVISESFNNAELQQSATIPSDGSGNYELSRSVEANGDFRAQIEIVFDGNVIEISEVHLVSADCVPDPDPALESFELVTDNESCEISLNWSVSNEAATGSYLIQAAVGGNDFTTIGQISVDADNPLATYSFIYIPETNDIHEFRIDRSGEMSFSSETLSTDITCFPEPLIELFTIADNEDCTFTLNWEVSNELTGANYQVLISIDGSDPVFFNDIEAGEDAVLANYQLQFTPEVNGNYAFTIQRMEAGNVQSAIGPVSQVVDCIPAPDPEFISFDISLNEPCSYALQWVVDHETANGIYEVWVSFNDGPYESATSFDAEDGSSTVSYEFEFAPTENGNFSFYIQRSGQSILATDPSEIDVTCIPDPDPVFGSFEVSNVEPCSFLFEWTVSHENNEGIYLLKSSNNGGEFSTIATIQSTGEAEQSDYQFMYEAVENGSHQFRLDRLENTVVTASAGLLEVIIDCIALPETEITEMRTDPENNCTYILRWNVMNEYNGGTYTVNASYNDGPNEILGTVASQGTMDQAFYHFYFTPEQNGDYVITVERTINGTPDVGSEALEITVDCIIEVPAIIEAFSIQENGDCSYLLEWEVSTETDEGSYRIMASSGGNRFAEIASMVSSGAAETATYEYVFHPEEDGIYIIMVQRFESGAFQALSSVQTINVVCNSAPEITQFNISESNCSLDLEWTVLNEHESGQYLIWMSFDDDEFEFIGGVEPVGELATATYNFSYIPEQNGTYDWLVVRVDDLYPESTSDIATTAVECVIPDEPVIESFDLVVDENCTILMAWQVSNETENAQYTILASLDGEDFEPVATTASNGDLEVTSYLYNFEPVANGFYEFKIVRSSGNSTITSETISSFIDCVQASTATFEDFDLISIGECNMIINWSVSGQSSDDFYIVYAGAKGGELTALETIQAGPESEQTFSYLYNADVNGDYNFRVEAWNDQQLISITQDMSAHFNCAPIPYVTLTVNPSITSGPFNVKMNSTIETEAIIRVVNTTTGFVALDEELFLTSGNNNQHYNMDNFNGAAVGLYSVIVFFNGESKSHPLMYTD